MKVTEYSYVLQFFKKLKLSTKLVPGQLSIHIKIYLEPFVSFLLPFFIYLKSSKCIFCNKNITLKYWFIFKDNISGNFYG